MRIIFLGTAGSFPTVQRNHPSIAIRRYAETMLFDCGEGTQRQIFRAKLGLCHKIFITHIHGDHILGLPGLLQTMSLLNRESPLKIFGPEGIHDFIKKIMEALRFTLTFPIEVNDVDGGLVCEEKGYKVEAAWMDHGIPSLAYALIEEERPGRFDVEKALSLGIPKGPFWFRLQHGEEVTLPDGQVMRPRYVLGPCRPGRKIVYSGDTRPCKAIVKLAENADLLIYETTLDDNLVEKAHESFHSTPSQGAKVAKESKAKRLIITHISARYEHAEILLKQARKVFPKTRLAEDFMELEIPYIT